jgi:hypothetical protein
MHINASITKIYLDISISKLNISRKNYIEVGLKQACDIEAHDYSKGLVVNVPTGMEQRKYRTQEVSNIANYENLMYITYI